MKLAKLALTINTTTFDESVARISRGYVENCAFGGS